MPDQFAVVAIEAKQDAFLLFLEEARRHEDAILGDDRRRMTHSGSGAVHAMFSVFDHLMGRFFSDE